jgi:hypothetical protein
MSEHLSGAAAASETPVDRRGRRVCGAPKRDGDPCGRVVLGQDGRCAAHTTLPKGEWVSVSASGPDSERAAEKKSRRTIAAMPVVVDVDDDAVAASSGDTASSSSGGFRQRLEKQTDEAWDSIERTLRETIESATRQEYVGCPSCGQRFPIVRRDYAAALRAVELMLDRVVAKKTAATEETDTGSFEDVRREQLSVMSDAELSAYMRWLYARDPDALMRNVEELRSFRQHFALHGAEGVIEHGARTGVARNEERLRDVYEALKDIFEPSPAPTA